ncbi:BREX system ATP-binding domain-containing protein [Fusibacter ferrireducens]|uniref:DUF2791 family P-loop domain-containing protein n=1 Tax=Fusibacter ferrireducens TaxID=2785058 RepID=A0ABR9ZXM5_9FIRM|nr:BREX system ATP-binding domain-containing protein [Fusibacter ferrireducens]MBF4695216.1 DUF2791 family P-loop domain-containing protein [Fusibacter ferrireducens]
MKLTLHAHEASKIINALRNGVAPVGLTENLIFGRQRELTEFNRCFSALKNGESIVKIITGEYGAGKSHLVHAIKNLALQGDYIIASFQVNGGFRLNKMDDLYYAIMHNLYMKGAHFEKTSFNEIFDLWIENLQTAPFPNQKRVEINTVCQEISKYNMNFARAFLMFMRGRIQRNQEMQNVTTSWLTGEKNIPFELKQKYDLIGHVDKTNTLDFLKAFSKLIHLLGYNGLIVFIDELDQIISERRDYRALAYNNLKHLIDLSASGEMAHSMFVFSGTPNLLSDYEKGFMSLEALSQRLNLPLDPDVSDPRQTVIHLERISEDAILSLVHQLIELYQIQDEPLDKMPSPQDVLRTIDASNLKTTRHVVTKAVQYLDTFLK